MIQILLIFLTVTQAFMWQTRPGAMGARVLYWLMAAVVAWVVYRRGRDFGRLTFWFVPALLIVVMAVSGSRAAPVPEWGTAPGAVFGYQVYWLAEDASTARYLIVGFFAYMYVLLSIYYTPERIARDLAAAGLALYVTVLGQVMLGLKPWTLILQQPSYGAVLCALLLPPGETLPGKVKWVYWGWGSVAVLMFPSQAGLLLLAAFWAYRVTQSLPVVMVTGGLGLAVVVPFLTQRSFIDRTLFWRHAVNDWLQHPLLGIGPGRFYHYGLSGSYPGYFAHSLPLTLLSETGIVGVLVLILFVAMIWGTRSKRPRWANQVLGLAGCAVLFDDPWLMWAITLVIAAALATTPPDAEEVGDLEEAIIRTQAAQYYYTERAKNMIRRLIT